MAFLNEIKTDLSETLLKGEECSVTCYSDKIVIIEGHKGLYHYDEGEIKVKVKSKKGLVSVKGNKLKIEEAGCAQLVISGEILSVALDGGL